MHAANASPSTATAAFFRDRSNWFWAVLAVVALAQVIALWVICSQQVKQAHSRHAATRVQHVAMYECLQSARGAAMASCRVRTAATSTAPVQAANTIGNGAMPVIYQR